MEYTLHPGVVLRKIAEQPVLLSTRSAGLPSILLITESAAFVTQCILQKRTLDEIVSLAAAQTGQPENAVFPQIQMILTALEKRGYLAK